MKVAIVHDWLTGMRGGEAVLEAVCRLLPGAPIYTLLWIPGSVSPRIEAHPIVTSFLQRLPGTRRHYRAYLPLFPLAVERFDLRGYERVISISHCVAKGAIPAPTARHLSYMHTPVRYAWDRFEDYFGRGRAPLPLRLIAHAVCHYLRLWDVASAPRVDRFIANSRFVAARIRRYYGREAEVLHPPVDCARFQPEPAGPEDYYLVVSALAPYKRVEDAIAACAALGRRLVVAGGGPGERRLRRLARRLGGGRIEVRGRVPAEELAALYARCRALLFPGVEDFGITPLEAMAAGRPVVALAEGGALETVVPLAPAHEAAASPPAEAPAPAPTGVLYQEPGPAGLGRAIEQLEAHLERFEPAALRAHALRFDRPRFERALAALLAAEGFPVARDPQDAGAPPSPAAATAQAAPAPC